DPNPLPIQKHAHAPSRHQPAPSTYSSKEFPPSIPPMLPQVFRKLMAASPESPAKMAATPEFTPVLMDLLDMAVTPEFSGPILSPTSLLVSSSPPESPISQVPAPPEPGICLNL
ncbi:hypothetical protein M9458_011570, partial [Cirrhinus mrigala]